MPGLLALKQESAIGWTGEIVMPLDFYGVDPETGDEGSPMVWVDPAARKILVQGETAGPADTAEISETEWVPGHRIGIPGHEKVIEIPFRMVPILREACDAAERAGLSDAAQGSPEDGSPSGNA
jgi:hypothetical protein